MTASEETKARALRQLLDAAEKVDSRQYRDLAMTAYQAAIANYLRVLDGEY